VAGFSYFPEMFPGMGTTVGERINPGWEQQSEREQHLRYTRDENNTWGIPGMMRTINTGNPGW